jgi:hypothetical protein
MIMARADYLPTEYSRVIQPEASTFFSSSQAYPVPTVFSVASEDTGWKVVKYSDGQEGAEDEADIQDSLEALEEPAGISLEDLKRDLDG